MMSRFNRILEIDYANRVVVAQPGVTNLGITHAVEQEGFYYAPDFRRRSFARSAATSRENSGACTA